MVSISKIKKIFFESMDWSHTIAHSVNCWINIIVSIINKMLMALKYHWKILNNTLRIHQALTNEVFIINIFKISHLFNVSKL